jgi:hypothetical protein
MPFQGMLFKAHLDAVLKFFGPSGAELVWRLASRGFALAAIQLFATSWQLQ